uniref:V-set domain containing T cell activation inhibitor 1 n=1 Tax=Myripristis murdjan TaxID=586833 RepID=A0A667ZAK5_9TELE
SAAIYQSISWGSQSDVESSNRSPIANLGKDVLLSCYIRSSSEAGAQASIVAITWRKEGLSGLVYQYQNGAANLENQNLGFRGRTELLPDAITSGNASLLLRSVRKSDDGVYSCEVISSSGGGTVSIHLRTAAFSETNFTTTKDILIADGARWLPKPNVTWLDHDGNILNGTTTLSPNFVGIFHVVSTLQPVTVRGTYTCRIENDLVTANSEATLTGMNFECFRIPKHFGQFHAPNLVGTVRSGPLPLPT